MRRKFGLSSAPARWYSGMLLIFLVDARFTCVSLFVPDPNQFGMSLSSNMVSVLSGVSSLLNAWLLNYYYVGSCKQFGFETCLPYVQVIWGNISGLAVGFSLYVLLIAYYIAVDHKDVRLENTTEYGPAYVPYIFLSPND